MEELAADFARANPDVEVKVTYGSSGNFHSQLSNGAPFDLFLSADIEYARRLAEAGLGDGGVFSYAVGRVVVWVPNGSKAPAGMEPLADAAVRKVAIANPAHAPYGRAAEAAMRHYGVYEKVKGKLVYGENVAQAAQFAQSGAAQAGVIALSLALAPAMKDKGRYWEIPLEAYPRIEQGGIILKRAENPAAARRLRDYLRGPDGKAVLKRYGFSPAAPGE